MNKEIKKIMSSVSPTLTSKLMFIYNFKKKLDLSNPQDFNEKLQYLKLKTYYNNPTITQCVDKYRVRSYLESIGMENLLPKLIAGPFYSAEKLRSIWDELGKCVIKCNHGCGYNILIGDKNSISLDKTIKTLNKWMNEDYWKFFCEPQYRFVRKAIIIEEYLDDNIETYKFYCFNGEPKVMYLSSNGENGEKDLYLDFYDMNMNWIDLTLLPHLHATKKAIPPINYNKMVEIARVLSRPFPFVRIDLYNIEGKIYFSEFTFIPTGGNLKLVPAHYIDDWGRMLVI